MLQMYELMQTGHLLDIFVNHLGYMGTNCN